MSVQELEPTGQPVATPGSSDRVAEHVREARAAFDIEDYDRVIRVCERLLAAHPDSAEAYLLLGLASWKLDEPLHAIDLLRRAQETEPEVSEYADALATILAFLGDSNESLYYAKLATVLAPHPLGKDLLPEKFREYFKHLSYARPHIYRNRAQDALDHGAVREAVRLLEKQIALTPDDPQTLRLASDAFLETGQIARAIHTLESVIERCATAGDHDRLARALTKAGHFEAALESHDTACALRPGDPVLEQGRLVTLARQFGDDTPAPQYAAACAAWFAAHGGDPERTRITFANPPQPDRPLRIGYVGGGLDSTGLAPLLDKVLTQHDRAAFETLIYASSTRHDMTSENLMRHCTRWTDLDGVDPVTAAHIMRNDGLDIVVDLTGHGTGSQLAALANGPAPVRLGWLGIKPASATGYDADLLCAEAGDTGGVLPFAHPGLVENLPAPASTPPCASNSYLTFGLVAPVHALSPETIDTARTVLGAVPGSRLLVANTDHIDTQALARIRALLEEAGLADRAVIAELESVRAHRAGFFEHIDIVLDPWPNGGFDETVEALWSGVPVLARSGSAGAQALAAGACEDWIYRDARALEAAACGLAADPDRLGSLRRALRERIAHTPLFDWRGFVTILEAAYRHHWRAWCAPRNGSAAGD